METSPNVPAWFSIMADMYIYACSKEKWTRPPDIFLRLERPVCYSLDSVMPAFASCLAGR